MTLQDLKTLLDYHYWARDRMLEAIEALTPEQFTRDQGNSFRSIRDTAAHMYSAEWVWYSRWRGTSPTSPLTSDLFPDVPTLRRSWNELEQSVRTFVDDAGEQGVDRVIEYKLLSGAAAAARFWQMLQHVVNHATYHRGQVTTMLRQLGAPPPKATDMIVYYRERA